MTIVTIQEPERVELLKIIDKVFTRKKRPATTLIHYRKISIKQEG